MPRPGSWKYQEDSTWRAFVTDGREENIIRGFGLIPRRFGAVSIDTSRDRSGKNRDSAIIYGGPYRRFGAWPKCRIQEAVEASIRKAGTSAHVRVEIASRFRTGWKYRQGRRAETFQYDPAHDQTPASEPREGGPQLRRVDGSAARLSTDADLQREWDAFLAERGEGEGE